MKIQTGMDVSDQCHVPADLTLKGNTLVTNVTTRYQAGWAPKLVRTPVDRKIPGPARNSTTILQPFSW